MLIGNYDSGFSLGYSSFSKIRIGKGVRIIEPCSIGAPPEWHNCPPCDPEGYISIGDNTEIREFVTINLPQKRETRIGTDCFLMSKSHVSHDNVLGNGCILATGAVLGGFTHLGDHVFMGINSCTHPFALLGDYCLVGAGSFFKGHSPRGIIWVGSPARPIKVNLIGLDRYPTPNREEIVKEAEEFIYEWRC